MTSSPPRTLTADALDSATRRFDAVICDIDGCLISESSRPMDAPALARVAEYNRIAHESRDRPVVTLCSGRPQPFAEAVCRLIGNHSLPLVAENGVWLYFPADNRYELDPSITEDHLFAIDAARRWVRSELGPRGVVMQPGKVASISLYHPSPDFLRTLQEPVRDRFAREGWPLRVSMTWLYINCDLTHISKGSGLERWAAATGLPRHRLAGIGDTPSDLAIAQRVTLFACPANADPALMPAAAYVARHPETLGVLEILDTLVGY